LTFPGFVYNEHSTSLTLIGDSGTNMAMNCTDEMEEFDIFKRNDYNQSWEPSMLDSVEYGVEHGVNDKNDEDVFSWSDVLANRLEANKSVDESTSVTAQNNAGGKTIPSVVTKKTKGSKKKNPSETKDNFSCSVCDKKFHFKSFFERHVRVHTKETPFECSTCGQKFSQSNNLKAHINTEHNGFKNECKLCGKWFTGESNLRSHVNLTHGMAEPIKCTTCGVFIRANFKRHTESKKHLMELEKAGVVNDQKVDGNALMELFAASLMD